MATNLKKNYPSMLRNTSIINRQCSSNGNAGQSQFVTGCLQMLSFTVICPKIRAGWMMQMDYDGIYGNNSNNILAI